MRNNYIFRILYALIFVFTLLGIYIKTPNGKIILIPFLLCGISYLGKYIALMVKNNRLALMFHKGYIFSFFLYWFGFLIYANYRSILDKEYSFILFSLIFWIVGIVFLKKALKK